MIQYHAVRVVGLILLGVLPAGVCIASDPVVNVPAALAGLQEAVTEAGVPVSEPCDVESRKPPQIPITSVGTAPKFNVKLVMELATDPTHRGGVRALSDCLEHGSSQFQADQALVLDALSRGAYAASEDFFSALDAYKNTWTSDEKICFVSQYQDLLADHYDIGDLMGRKLDTDDMLRTLAAGEGSSGVCIHIHRSGSEVGNALGLQCGTLAVGWETGDSGTGDRASHVTSVCKGTDGRYFLANYGSGFEVHAASYQEALDATNLFMGPFNVSSSVMSCIDPGMKKSGNCDHIYLPRDARWGLSLLQKGMGNLREGIELAVQLSNLGLGGGIAVGEHRERPSGDGKRTRTLDAGVLAVEEVFGSGENSFGAAGFARTGAVEGEKTRAQSELFLGAYHSRAANQGPEFYVDAKTLSTTGLMAYARGNRVVEMSPSTRVNASAEGVAAIAPSIGPVVDGGAAMIARGELEQDLDPRKSGAGNSVFVAYEGAPTGSLQNNTLDMSDPQVEAGLRLKAGDGESTLEVRNEVSVHYLGKSSTAVENELQATVRVGQHAVIEGRSHLGQTFSEDDPFYDSGLYHENRLKLGHQAEEFVFSVEGILTSGSIPAQFGEGLTLEERVLPQPIAPGSYIGVRYEGRF